jgi:CRP/FNR family transcriptional regulator
VSRSDQGAVSDGEDSRRAFERRLRATGYFATLDDEVLRELISVSTRKRVQAGEVVLAEGEMAEGLYWLASGWLKVVKYAATGREQVLAFLEGDRSFHEIGAFTDLPNPASVIALEPSSVWCMPKAEVQRLLDSQPGFARHVIETMALRMQQLVLLIEDLSLRSVTARLAKLLLDEAGSDGVMQRPRWFTQQQLAARLGTVPDVVQRALRRLETDGMIRIERDAIHLLDRADLALLAG